MVRITIPKIRDLTDLTARAARHLVKKVCGVYGLHGIRDRDILLGGAYMHPDPADPSWVRISVTATVCGKPLTVSADAANMSPHYTTICNVNLSEE